MTAAMLNTAMVGRAVGCAPGAGAPGGAPPGGCPWDAFARSSMPPSPARAVRYVLVLVTPCPPLLGTGGAGGSGPPGPPGMGGNRRPPRGVRRPAARPASAPHSVAV